MKRFIEILSIPFWFGVMIWDFMFPPEIDLDEYFKKQKHDYTKDLESMIKDNSYKS